MNNNKKLFGKISIIDILVVLAILVAAFGIYNRFFIGEEKVETSSAQIEYTLKVPEVRIGTINALKTYGGEIFDTTTKENFGEIVNVTYEDAKKSFLTVNGQYKESVIPERYDAIITVRVLGKLNNSGYYTKNNQPIAAGSSLTFYSKAANSSGKIIDIYEVK